MRLRLLRRRTEGGFWPRPRQGREAVHGGSARRSVPCEQPTPQGRVEDWPRRPEFGGPHLEAFGTLPRRSRPIASSRFHQEVLPVGRDPSGWSGHGLVEGVMLRRCEARPFHVFVCSVAPKPIFAWLEAADDRVT